MYYSGGMTTLNLISISTSQPHSSFANGNNSNHNTQAVGGPTVAEEGGVDESEGLARGEQQDLILAVTVGADRESVTAFVNIDMTTQPGGEGCRKCVKRLAQYRNRTTRMQMMRGDEQSATQ